MPDAPKHQFNVLLDQEHGQPGRPPSVLVVPPRRPMIQQQLPRQGMTWQEFLTTHWEVPAAADSFTVELWTAKGLIRYHVLFVIKLATREVQIEGIVPEPGESWMGQMARNLTDPWTGFLRSSRWRIHDRSTLFSEHFRQLLRSA